jgi:hypothetical protein
MLTNALQSTPTRPVCSRQGCRILAVLLLYGLAEQMQHLLPHPVPPRPPRPPRPGITICPAPRFVFYRKKRLLFAKKRVLFQKKRKMPSTSNHSPILVSNHYCLCEKTAENGVSGSCFRRPFHRTLTVGLAALGSYPKLQRFRASMCKLIVR